MYHFLEHMPSLSVLDPVQVDDWSAPVAVVNTWLTKISGLQSDISYLDLLEDDSVLV